MKQDLGAPLAFSHYDRRRYRTVPVEEGYAVWSRVYADLQDRFDVDLLDASPLLAERVPGARVVDLGCGNGRIGKWLAGAGAGSLAGVDRSAAMLEVARERGVYERAILADVTRTGLPAGDFDGAVTSLVLCHLADISPFFAEARRLVRPGGWLAIVDYHPLFLMLGIPTHFVHPDSGEHVAIENHVHALRDFFREGTRAGFAVRELEERFVTEEWAEALPRYRPHLGLPITCYWAFA